MEKSDVGGNIKDESEGTHNLFSVALYQLYSTLHAYVCTYVRM